MSVVYEVSAATPEAYNGDAIMRIFRVIENPEGSNSSHRINIEVIYGVIHSESGKASACAQTVYSIFTDDEEIWPPYDEKGARIFPMYIVHTNTTLSGQLVGLHLQPMMQMMGEDAQQMMDGIEDILGPISANHTAFKLHALSYLEETEAYEGSIKDYTDHLDTSSVYDQMGVLYFIIGALCTEEETANKFRPVFQRLKEHYAARGKGDKPTLKVVK